MITDVEGKVKFQIISDHFSELQDIEKKHISRMLIKARYDEKQEGELNGSLYNYIRYSSSIELDYIPSALLYKSKVWSVFLALLSIGGISLIVYLIFRRRRNNWKKILEDES